MKPIISLRFKNEANEIRKAANFSALLLNTHWDKVQKIEMIPSDKAELNIIIGDKVVFTREPQTDSYDEEKILSVVEEAIKEYLSKRNQNVDCFGWNCSDHLRKTSN